MAGAVGSAGSLREVIDRLIGVSFDELRNDSEWNLLFMEISAQAMRHDEARDMVSGCLGECREMIARFLEIGQSAGVVRGDLAPGLAAGVVTALLDGIALHWAVDPAAVDLRGLREVAVDLIERFVGAEGPADLGDAEEILAELLSQLGQPDRPSIAEDREV